MNQILQLTVLLFAEWYSRNRPLNRTRPAHGASSQAAGRLNFDIAIMSSRLL